MFFRKSHNKSWMKLSSALLGGFLLGFTYQKYGGHLSHRIRNMIRKNNHFDEYFPDEETEV